MRAHTHTHTQVQAERQLERKKRIDWDSKGLSWREMGVRDSERDWVNGKNKKDRSGKEEEWQW